MLEKVLLIYMLLINLGTFMAFGVDKRQAIAGGRRIRVAVLLGLAAAGGSAGGLLAMYIFRHKTRKACFTVGIPVLLVLQLVLLCYLRYLS